MATNPYVEPDDPITALIKKNMPPQQSLVGPDMPPDSPDLPLPPGGEGGLPGAEVPVVDHPEVQPEKPEVPGAAGPDAAAPTWLPGKKAGQDITLLGFDHDKLNDPNAGSPGKYSPAVRAFYQGLKQDVGLSRGGLDNMIGYLKSNGFKDAKAVGDDKIDFGDGNGPVDVIRSDGQIVFQNTTGNPVWEAAHPGETPDAAAGPVDNSGGGGMTLSLDSGGVPSDAGFFNKLMEAAQKAQGGNMNRQSLLHLLGLG